MKIIINQLAACNRKLGTHLPKNSTRGSVTMEYIIVSSFALLVSISAVTWLGTIVKDRVTKIASKMGVEATEFDLDLDLHP